MLICVFYAFKNSTFYLEFTLGVRMEYNAKFTMNEQYFSESFEEWLQHASKFRKWEVRIGVLFLAGSCLMYISGRVDGKAWLQRIRPQDGRE